MIHSLTSIYPHSSLKFQANQEPTTTSPPASPCNTVSLTSSTVSPSNRSIPSATTSSNNQSGQHRWRYARMLTTNWRSLRTNWAKLLRLAQLMLQHFPTTASPIWLSTISRAIPLGSLMLSSISMSRSMWRCNKINSLSMIPCLTPSGKRRKSEKHSILRKNHNGKLWNSSKLYTDCSTQRTSKSTSLLNRSKKMYIKFWRP